MGDVIGMEGWKHRRRGRPGPDLTAEQNAELRRQAEEKVDHDRQALASETRGKLEHAKLNAADREALARNLWHLIERAKKAGIQKRQITETAHLGDGISSKRLDRYTLRDGMESGQREMRLSNLAAKSEIYLRLAEAAAGLANWNADDAVLDLVAGSSLSARSKGKSSHVPEEYVHLNGLLQTLCRWVQQRSDIERILTLAERQSISGSVGHWSKDSAEYYLSGFETPSVKLGYLKCNPISDSLGSFLPLLEAEITDHSGETVSGQIAVAASVHLCLARWHGATTLRPYFGFAPALVHRLIPDGSSEPAPLHFRDPTVVDISSVSDSGEILGHFVDIEENFKVRVSAEEVQNHDMYDAVTEIGMYYADVDENLRQWFTIVIEANADSIFEIFGKYQPVLMRGEWLCHGDTPTECLDPGAAALERVLIAPDQVPRKISKPEYQFTQVPIEPEGGWLRPTIGPIEELWINSTEWCDSLGLFIDDLQLQAKRATVDTRALYAMDSPPIDT